MLKQAVTMRMLAGLLCLLFHPLASADVSIGYYDGQRGLGISVGGNQSYIHYRHKYKHYQPYRYKQYNKHYYQRRSYPRRSYKRSGYNSYKRYQQYPSYRYRNNKQYRQRNYHYNTYNQSNYSYGYRAEQRGRRNTSNCN